MKTICRDPKDGYLLALAKAGKADLLITGDEDLLVLKKYGKTRVLKPADFLKKYLKRIYRWAGVTGNNSRL